MVMYFLPTREIAKSLPPCERRPRCREGWKGVASRCRGFRYMDGLRRFPSFIKCGHRTQPDAELILQKKQGGRATTSLVSLSYKSPASAAALRGAGVTFATLLQPQQYKVTDHSHSHYEWVMWQCKNILYTSSITVGHSQHLDDECASFKCGIISKWNALQLEPPFVFSRHFLLYPVFAVYQKKKEKKNTSRNKNLMHNIQTEGVPDEERSYYWGLLYC